MATAVTAERHLHVVPPPLPLPWWCRTFGHTYVSRVTTLINTTRWMQPPTVPLTVMCRRCGMRP